MGRAQRMTITEGWFSLAMMYAVLARVVILKTWFLRTVKLLMSYEIMHGFSRQISLIYRYAIYHEYFDVMLDKNKHAKHLICFHTNLAYN